ncbi:hypothetical protein [Cupriavidus sp. RAF12]|uniref:hypothetical protein n=1 Tax=Cupriavidus sp. RAF12 TaxID=3233050 RepID=UPI003F93B7FD
MKYAILTLSWLVAGCVTQVALIDASGNASHFSVNPASRTVSGAIDGKAYSGSYVTNQSTWRPMFTESKGRSFQPAAWTSPGSSGQALLFASDGANLHCDFGYQGLTVMGQCHGSHGASYVLTTDAPP